MVEVNDAHVKKKFHARTDMSWQDFTDIAYDRFRKGCDEVLMGYKLAGESSGVTELASEVEWKNAMICMEEKIKSTHTCSVTMEIRNMVSIYGHTRS